MKRLEGKIAIITGAGQGLGEGTAHAMTQEGACVALWGRTFEKVEHRVPMGSLQDVFSDEELCLACSRCT